MPGPASHLYIAEKIADTFSFYNEQEVKSLVSGVNDKYYKMGATGPDLWFFAPDYKAVRITEMLLEFVNSVVQPIQEIYDDTIKPVVDKIDEVEEKVDAVLDEVTCQNISNIKDRTDGITDTIAAIRDGFFVKIFTDAVNTFDIMQHPVHKDGDPPKEWYWFDLLHSRRTGQFVNEMWNRATNSKQKAYVLGYASHVAADVTGHPYINQSVGGAGRGHNQRHHFVENILDVWFYSQESPPIDVTNSQLHRDLPHGHELDDHGTLLSVLNGTAESKEDLDEIFTMVSEAMAEVFKDELPEHLPTGFTTAEDINLAYWFLLASFKVSTDSYIPPPPHPTDGLMDEINEAIDEFLSSTGGAPVGPGSGPDLCHAFWSSDCDFSLQALEDWLKHQWDKIVFLAEMIKWAAEVLVELFQVLACIITAPLKATVSALLWIIHSALREILEEIRKSLSMAAIVHPTPDWVATNPIATEMTSLSNDFIVDSLRGNYPHQAPDSNEGFLGYPTTDLEGAATVAGPYQVGATPFSFLYGLPTDKVGGEALYDQYAGEGSPSSHIVTQNANKDKSTFSAIELGRKLFLDLVNNEDSAIPDWNLDADRGFQYKNWTVPEDADWGKLESTEDVPDKWHLPT